MDTHEKEEFDLQGRIGLFTLTDLLQTLSFTQKTGTLTLIQGWNTRTICFENGRISYIAAATRLPSVVDLFISAGKLNPAQLQQHFGYDWKRLLGVAEKDSGLVEPDSSPAAIGANVARNGGSASSNGKRERLPASGPLSSKLDATEPNLEEMGDIEVFVPPTGYTGNLTQPPTQGPDPSQLLLQHRLVTLDDLAWIEEQMLETTIYTLFLWRNCRFTFQGDLLVKTDGTPVSVSAEKLIIEGTRRVDEWIKISPVVPSVLMAFRRLARPATGPLSDEARDVLAMVDGVSDVASIARKRQRTQFETAKLLHGLTTLGLVQPVPPNKQRVMELFRYTAEAIYIKLVMYGYSRKAMEFEYELNRFCRENRLKTRMHVGKIRMTDQDLVIDTIALLDLYKLFIAIENNRFHKLFPPEIHKGLTEALYQHMDRESRALMRMYEFHALEGLLDMKEQVEAS
jgi:Domain of unknown function (DUF4388)